MARPEIAALFNKEFIDLKIDTDRTAGAKEFAEKLGAKGGIPWYTILDASGKALITSTTEGDNIGFPANAAEITRFGSMLKKSVRTLTGPEIQTLLDSLQAANK